MWSLNHVSFQPVQLKSLVRSNKRFAIKYLHKRYKDDYHNKNLMRFIYAEYHNVKSRISIEYEQRETLTNPIHL